MLCFTIIPPRHLKSYIAMVRIVLYIIIRLDIGVIIIGVIIKAGEVGYRLGRRPGIPGITTARDIGSPANGLSLKEVIISGPKIVPGYTGIAGIDNKVGVIY